MKEVDSLFKKFIMGLNKDIIPKEVLDIDSRNKLLIDAINKTNVIEKYNKKEVKII